MFPKRSTKHLKGIGHILIKTPTIQKLFKLQKPTEKTLHHYTNSPIHVPSLYIPARKS